MRPTVEQAMELYRMCQQLTKMYLPIYLVCLDERTQDIIILAGDETEVYMHPLGEIIIV